MSNIPTPKQIPPSHQQVTAVLKSVTLATQELLSDPKNGPDLRTTLIHFFAQPVIQLVLGFPSQAPATTTPSDSQLKAELSELKSNILALSKSVADLTPRITKAKAPTSHPPLTQAKSGAQGQGPKHVTPPTYASKATVKARPSLVLDLGQTNPDLQFPPNWIMNLNMKLQSLEFQDVKISAMSYTKKGNLTLIAHPNTVQSRLTAATSAIATFYKACHDHRFPTHKIDQPPIRTNVKWSKLLINSVPTGHPTAATEESWRTYTPDECHKSLTANNPSYTTLTITQKPSWVRIPTTYNRGTRSSLVFAFEDPDGSARRSLLSNKQLFIHGVRAKVSHWKEKPRTHTHPPSPDNSPEENVQVPPDTQTAEDPVTKSPAPSSPKRLPPPTPSTPPKPSTKPKRTRLQTRRQEG